MLLCWPVTQVLGYEEGKGAGGHPSSVETTRPGTSPATNATLLAQGVFHLSRIIHLADLHLGWQPRFIPDRAAAQVYADERFAVFSAAVEHALDPANGIAAVVVAGDLFDDHRPAPALVEKVLAGLARLATRHVATVVVPGNHDEITYSDSVYRSQSERWPGLLATSAGMAPLGTVRSGDQDMHFYGMAYTGGVTEVSSPLREFPRVDRPGLHIAVIHGTVVGAAGGPDWASAERSLPLDAAALAAAGYDYVALGHIHGAHTAAGRPLAHYAGMVAGRGFDDPGCGFLTVVEFGPQGPMLQRIAFEGRRISTVLVRAAGEAGVDALLDAAAGQLSGIPAGSIVRVVLLGHVAAPVDATALRAALAARGEYLHVEVRDSTSLLGPDQIERWSREPTVRGFFVRRLAASAAGAAPGGPDDVPRDPRLVERALRHGLAALAGGRRD